MLYRLLNILTHSRSQQTISHGPNAYFVNKVLMEHRHTHLFTYCLWMLLATTAEYHGCNIDLLARKAKNIYSLDIYRESVPTPGVQLSHLIIFRKRGPRSPQLVSSGVRAQTSDICPPMSQGQILRDIPFPRDTSLELSHSHSHLVPSVTTHPP